MADERVIKIDKGVPIPDKRRCGITAAMREMQIGDSMLLPIAGRAGFNGLASRCGIKVTIRKEGADKVRVWRIA